MEIFSSGAFEERVAEFQAYDKNLGVWQIGYLKKYRNQHDTLTIPTNPIKDQQGNLATKMSKVPLELNIFEQFWYNVGGWISEKLDDLGNWIIGINQKYYSFIDAVGTLIVILKILRKLL